MEVIYKPVLAAIFFLVILTQTTAHEAHHKAHHNVSISANDTQQVAKKEQISSGSDDYEWTNNDDYVNDYPNDEAHADIISKSEANGSNETAKLPNLLTNSSSEAAALRIQTDNGSTPKTGDAVTSPSLQSNSNESLSNSEATQTEKEALSSSADVVSSTVASDNADGVTSEDSTASTSSEKMDTNPTEAVPTSSPSPIITQDYGDVSNTSASIPVIAGSQIDPAGFRTWAVVVVSVLVSFAVIFTILYFIRGELIRRRKADQRRLLRGSISSEGYFYGDGEGNTSGKFEL